MAKEMLCYYYSKMNESQVEDLFDGGFYFAEAVQM